jgi:ubiquinone/menaquinone biosynthesis C-methylase UbiE
MPWLMARVYDRVMAPAEAACLGPWRRELFADLNGRVLEVGAGTGGCLPYYPDRVDELVLAEPDPHMRRQLEARARERAGTRVIADSVEALGLADASFDAVVSSLLLCSVAHPQLALAQLHRVLRPGGTLVFLEHVAAWDNPQRLRWQHRLEPAWKQLAGNCHLTRDTERAIVDAGFELEQIERDRMRKAIPWVRPCIRGRARKPAG